MNPEKDLHNTHARRVVMDLICRLEEHTGYVDVIERLDRTLCDYIELGRNLNLLIAEINKLLALWEKR